MAWDREKRGIFQRKQEKPQIKKHKPLDSEGNDGDITIRQLDDGVFMFFKALGKWYKTLNAQSQIIPETPNARSLGSPDRPMRKMYVSSKSLHMGDTKREQAKISLSSDRKELVFTDRDGKLRNMIGRETGTADETDVNNDYVTVIGKDNITNAQGWLALGSGASDLGGVIQGAASLANTDESGYLGLRVLASSPTNKKQFTLGAAMISPFSTHKVAIGTFNKTGDVSIGGFIDIAECALDPPTAPPAGSITLYAKSDGLYVYQDSSVTNLMGTYLPLAGGTMTGHTTLNDNVKMIFGDADEYILGDGTKLYISSSDWINFNNKKIENINTIQWLGGAMRDFLDQDDMASNSTTAAPSQQSVKAYVDTTHRWSQHTAGYRLNNNSSTNYYFQYRYGDHSWNNYDSSPTSISVYDSYASIFIAPYAGTLDKISVHGYASDTGATDPIKFYVYKGTPSAGSTSLSLTQIGETDSITPASLRIFVEVATISSSNAFAREDAIFVMYKKDSTSGNQDLYFSVTLSGTYTQ